MWRRGHRLPTKPAGMRRYRGLRHILPAGRNSQCIIHQPRFTKATHYIINYQKMTTDRIFRVEAYYKEYDALIKTVPVNYSYSNYTNGGSGLRAGV